MKIPVLMLAVLSAFTAVGAAQTVNPGQHVFINDEGAFTFVIDAALAVEKINSPYILFIAYFVSDGGGSFEVNREDVVMIYNEREYSMPSYKEWRKEYTGGRGDMMLASRLGKETLGLSRLRHYYFPNDSDFFPDGFGILFGDDGFQEQAVLQEPRLQEGRPAGHPGEGPQNPRVRSRLRRHPGIGKRRRIHFVRGGRGERRCPPGRRLTVEVNPAVNTPVPLKNPAGRPPRGWNASSAARIRSCPVPADLRERIFSCAPGRKNTLIFSGF